jgi:hypothetical protein
LENIAYQVQTLVHLVRTQAVGERDVFCPLVELGNLGGLKVIHSFTSSILRDLQHESA